MASMSRIAAPILKNSAKNFAKKLVRKGAETSIGLASDALRGKNMNEAILRRLGGGQKRGRKRKQAQARRQTLQKKKKNSGPRKQNDIFS